MHARTRALMHATRPVPLLVCGHPQDHHHASCAMPAGPHARCEEGRSKPRRPGSHLGSAPGLLLMDRLILLLMLPKCLSVWLRTVSRTLPACAAISEPARDSPAGGVAPPPPPPAPPEAAGPPPEVSRESDAAREARPSVRITRPPATPESSWTATSSLACRHGRGGAGRSFFFGGGAKRANEVPRRAAGGWVGGRVCSCCFFTAMPAVPSSAAQCAGVTYVASGAPHTCTQIPYRSAHGIFFLFSCRRPTTQPHQPTCMSSICCSSAACSAAAARALSLGTWWLEPSCSLPEKMLLRGVDGCSICRAAQHACPGAREGGGGKWPRCGTQCAGLKTVRRMAVRLGREGEEGGRAVAHGLAWLGLPLGAPLCLSLCASSGLTRH